MMPEQEPFLPQQPGVFAQEPPGWQSPPDPPDPSFMDDLPEAEAPVQPQGDGQPMTFGEISEQHRAPFHGLLHLGYLTATFEHVGHKIVIHTLSSEEELIVGDLIQEWNNTVAATKAYSLAIAALCVQFIDGQPMPAPLGETTRDAWARERFEYAKRWYPSTVDAIFTRYLELEAKVRQVLAEMGKAPLPGAGSNGNSGSPIAEGYFADVRFPGSSS